MGKPSTDDPIWGEDPPVEQIARHIITENEHFCPYKEHLCAGWDQGCQAEICEICGQGDKPTVQRTELAPGVIRYKPAVTGVTPKEALEFYAKQENYEPRKEREYQTAPVFADHGRLAQAALAGLKTK